MQENNLKMKNFTLHVCYPASFNFYLQYKKYCSTITDSLTHTSIQYRSMEKFVNGYWNISKVKKARTSYMYICLYN